MGTFPPPTLAWDLVLGVTLPVTGHRDLVRALRRAVDDGRLPPGSQLPPSRLLAESLGCSRWVVTEAYGLLVADGTFEARTRSGTRVARHTQQGALPRSTLPTPRLDLRPGSADLSLFPRDRWHHAIKAVLAVAPHEELAPTGRAGDPTARGVLADYLARGRGAHTSGPSVVVTRGSADGLARLFRGLHHAGHTHLAVEDPGWTRPVQIARATGLTVVPVPVDDCGLRVDDLSLHPQVRAALVSPSCHFPSGTCLSEDRRGALADWARQVDGLILEHDVEAILCPLHARRGVLQGRAPDHTALVGTLSMALGPGLGIGWTLLPERWDAEMAVADPGAIGPPLIDQMAFARLITDGDLDRHLRLVRSVHRRRGRELASALRSALPQWHVSEPTCGAHLFATPPDRSPLGIDALCRRLRSHGAAVETLDTYSHAAPPEHDALVLGYGNLRDHEVHRVVALLSALA